MVSGVRAHDYTGVMYDHTDMLYQYSPRESEAGQDASHAAGPMRAVVMVGVIREHAQGRVHLQTHRFDTVLPIPVYQKPAVCQMRCKDTRKPVCIGNRPDASGVYHP